MVGLHEPRLRLSDGASGVTLSDDRERIKNIVVDARNIEESSLWCNAFGGRERSALHFLDPDASLVG